MPQSGWGCPNRADSAGVSGYAIGIAGVSGYACRIDVENTLAITRTTMPVHRARANRNWASLLLQRETRGAIRDKTGLRYRVGPDYVVAGDDDRAERYFKWFAREFPDDAGEPIHLLYRAIERFNCDDIEVASRHLKEAMLSNLYMLPRVFGDPIGRLDVWHGSNWSEPEYLEEVEDYLSPITLPQRQWIRARYSTSSFTELRDKYIEAYAILLTERNVQRRSKVLDSLALYVATNRSSVSEGDG